MRMLSAPAAAWLVLALGGCAATGETGRDLAGFPIDEKCMAFWQDSPSYHGNRTLAYAQNCATGGDTRR